MTGAAFLAEALLRSVLIGGFALAAFAAFAGLGRCAAADRVTLLRVALALMLLSPLSGLIGFRIEIPMPGPAAAPSAHGGTAAASGPPVDVFGLLTLIYLAGLGGLLLRLAFGLLTLARWTRRARPVTAAPWMQALGCLAPQGAAPRLLVSADTPAPLSWGWPGATILIDPDTLAREADAASVIAHECAHIRRGDWPGLMLGRIAVAVFWCNPLVWLMQHLAQLAAEDAVDDEAARVAGRREYAQALLNCAAPGGAFASNAMSGSALGRRVLAVLASPTRARRSLLGVGMTAVCIAVMAPAAMIDLAYRAPAIPASAPIIRVEDGEGAVAPQDARVSPGVQDARPVRRPERNPHPMDRCRRSPSPHPMNRRRRSPPYHRSPRLRRRTPPPGRPGVAKAINSRAGAVKWRNARRMTRNTFSGRRPFRTIGPWSADSLRARVRPRLSAGAARKTCGPPRPDSGSPGSAGRSDLLYP